MKFARNPATLLSLVAAVLLATAIGVSGKSTPSKSTSTTSYKVVKLIGSAGSGGKKKDKHMINAWGDAFFSGGPFWINDNGTGLSELIDGKGKIDSSLPFVTIPNPKGGASQPTGIVANNTSGFAIPSQGAALFLFATQEGTIAGWNAGTSATTIVDNSASGAMYVGLAMATAGSAPQLYAANQKSPGSIDVFDQDFNPVTPSGGFIDPDLPANFVPYNVTNLDNNLFVAYSEGMQAVGRVDEFDPNGNLIMAFTDASLNEPWGLAIAPANFGEFSNDLLVGNLGDGTISAFNPADAEFLGQLSGPHGKLIIPGLWSLVDGDGAMNATPDTIYFTSGPQGYAAGLFGEIQAGKSKTKKTKDPTSTPTSMPTSQSSPTATPTGGAATPTSTPTERRPTATPTYSIY